MPINSGTKFGPYEILSPLGAGGMGEVYKARDSRLDRVVAIKVLPSDFASSPEVKERFKREARTISSLSHPHICALFDIGQQDGVEYLSSGIPRRRDPRRQAEKRSALDRRVVEVCGADRRRAGESAQARGSASRPETRQHQPLFYVYIDSESGPGREVVPGQGVITDA